MSIPRCPAEYGVAGAMNGRTIWCAPRTGHAQRGWDADEGAVGIANTPRSVSASTRAGRIIHRSCQGEEVRPIEISEKRTTGSKCGRWGTGAILLGASRAIRMTTRVRYPAIVVQTAWMHTTTQSFWTAHSGIVIDPRIVPVEIVWPCADTRFRTKRCG